MTSNKEYQKQIKETVKALISETPKCGVFVDDNKVSKCRHIVTIEQMHGLNKSIKKSLCDIRKLLDLLLNDTMIIEKKIEKSSKALAFEGIDIPLEAIKNGIEAKKTGYTQRLENLGDRLRTIELSEEIQTYSNIRDEWFKLEYSSGIIFLAIKHNNRPLDEEILTGYKKEVTRFFEGMGFELNKEGLEWFINSFSPRKFDKNIASDTRKSEAMLLNELTGMINHVWLSALCSNERKAITHKIANSWGELANNAQILVNDARELTKEIKDWLK